MERFDRMRGRVSLPIVLRALGVASHAVLTLLVMFAFDRSAVLTRSIWLKAILLAVITLWPDVYRWVVGWVIGDQVKRPVRPLRLFFGFLVTGGLFVALSRLAVSFVSRANPIGFQILLLIAVAGIVLWDQFAAYTPVGQRWMESRRARRLAVGIGVVSCCLIGVEVVLNNPYARRNLIGNWSKAHYSSEFLERNSNGFRDREHEIAKPDGVVRILVLGDSVTWGMGTPIESVYTARLAEYGGAQVEVINAAAPGDNFVDHFLRVREFGCQYQPDILLLAASVYDWEVATTSQYPEYSVEGLPDQPAVVPSVKILRHFESDYAYNPTLFYLVDGSFNNLIGRNKDWELTADQWELALEVWQKAAFELAAAADECDIPHRFAFPVASTQAVVADEYYQRIADLYANAGFEAINLQPAYREAFGHLPLRGLWVSYDDGHPNAELHQWYADQLWSIIEPAVIEELRAAE